jgi:hypothetical protein
LDILVIVQNEVNVCLKTKQNSKFWWKLPTLFQNSYQMNLGFFKEKCDIFDENAFNSFSSIEERFFRFQFHLFELLSNNTAQFFVVLTYYLYFELKKFKIQESQLNNIFEWIQR